MNELVGQSKLGIDLVQKDIPVDEQVEGACEMLGLDPLYVANEGLFIAIVDGSVADLVVARMRSDEIGKSAAIIGEVVSHHPGQVVMASRIGGKRVVNYLTGEQLPRIC
jgi:hydrogenase expression/formation protein HypE